MRQPADPLSEGPQAEAAAEAEAAAALALASRTASDATEHRSGRAAPAPPDVGPAAPGPGSTSTARGARRPAARRDPSALFADIAAEPWRWHFFVAMRHVEAAHPQLPRLGSARRPADEPLRLAQPPDLSFAPSTIAAVDRDAPGGRPRVDVRFLGLWGPNGALPLNLTAQARERLLQHKDPTLARFADLFHHRLLLLFYRAWAQAQPTANLDRPGEDRFADFVGSFIGTGGAAWRGRDAAPDHARLAFSGVLARQVRNADGLAHLLSGYLGRSVRVESFAGRWMALAEPERTRLAGRLAPRARRATARLGVSAVLGRAVFDRQHHFRLHVGPLDLAAFESLLPVGAALPAVQALVRHYAGDELGWDLRLELAAPEVPAVRLGRAGRLGWTSWVGRLPAGVAGTLNLRPRAPVTRPAASDSSSR